MKRSIASLLALFTVATAHAGSFGGPPPFTNGSPLVSGVQGSYQATARGNGLFGIIRFSYSSTGVPSLTGKNNYVFFVAGTIVTGTTDAAILTTQLTGVLETPSAVIPPPSMSYFDSLGGYFAGSFDTKSPYYAFSGSGSLQCYESYSVTDPVHAVSRDFKLSGVRISLNVL